jgi:hypothetical protein
VMSVNLSDAGKSEVACAIPSVDLK